MLLSIISPTYNEADNIYPFIEKINKSLNTNVEAINHNTKIMSLDWAEIINLPKIELDVDMHETIKNGQLLPRNMFSNEENYIISIESNIVAIYKPFNEKYYKPEKVLL